MRIVYVTAMLPFGPMEAFIIPEIAELRARGHEVLVVPMWPRGAVIHEDARTLLDVTRTESLLLSPRILAGAMATLLSAPGRSMAQLASLASTRSPRLLAMNAVVFPKALWLARLLRQWRADHLHAHWLSAPSTMAYIASELAEVPWSATAHRYDIYQRNLLCAKAKSARFIRVISNRGATDLRRLVEPYGAKVFLIHMGVPLPSIETKPPRPPDRPLNVIVGANLREVKGHRYLINAVRIAKEQGVPVHVDVAGDGPLRPELESLVHDLRVASDVTFLGVVPHDELLARMRSGLWDAAALPSVAISDTEQEGIPVFLIEAMACGLPVIGTATGGIPELLGESAGVIVPERDPTALAGALSTLAQDAAHREHLGKTAQERVQRQFSVQRTVDALLDLFAASR